MLLAIKKSFNELSRKIVYRERYIIHARQGITFNVVCPGPTETGLLKSFLREADNPEKLSEAFRRAIPMGRLGQPSDLPGIIVFLASDDAAFITGQVISVSGGLTMNG